MCNGNCSCTVERDDCNTTTTSSVDDSNTMTGSVSISDGDDGAGDVGGRVVAVVGVKLDSRSKELLTWALVKVAQTGDHVVAVHVIDPNSGKIMPEVEKFFFLLFVLMGVLHCCHSFIWLGVFFHIFTVYVVGVVYTSSGMGFDGFIFGNC